MINLHITSVKEGSKMAEQGQVVFSKPNGLCFMPGTHKMDTSNKLSQVVLLSRAGSSHEAE